MYEKSQKSLSSPRIGGVQWSATVGSTLLTTGEHGAGRGNCPGQLLGLAGVAPASWWLMWAPWWSLWRVPSSMLDVAARRGSCWRGSCFVQDPYPVRGVRPRPSRVLQRRKYEE